MKKTTIAILLGIAFICFLLETRIAKYYQFHKADIHGRITSIYRYHDYVMMSVDSMQYRIRPIARQGNYKLEKIAVVGDTILKGSDHDEFTLVHEGDEAYTFTVRKF